MAEVNIDGAQVARLNASKSKEQIVQMQNGCICCTLRPDLIENVGKLAAERRFEESLRCSGRSVGSSEPPEAHGLRGKGGVHVPCAAEQ